MSRWMDGQRVGPGNHPSKIVRLASQIHVSFPELHHFFKGLLADGPVRRTLPAEKNPLVNWPVDDENRS